MAFADSSRRVVVTGMGTVCPLGLTTDEMWSAIESGTSGVAEICALPSQGLQITAAGEARNFSGQISNFGQLEKSKKRVIQKALRMMCRECQMGVAAAQSAVEQSGFTTGAYDPERVGVVFGSDYMLSPPTVLQESFEFCGAGAGEFEFSQWGGDGMKQLNPLWLLNYLPNMPACHIAIVNDLRGANNSLTQREAAANLAVAEAYRTIMRGTADVMVTGATGTRVHAMRSLQVIMQEEVATNGHSPAELSRPFDAGRSGMILGEGAGALVLELLDRALDRGAPIFAEVIGYGASSVSHAPRQAARREAVTNALRATLKSAGLAPDEIGHVHAHGLSTLTGDAEEAQAIRDVFGDVDIPVTAAKSYFGNLGAGSGAVELAASILSLGREKMIPVLNYTTPDEGCPVRVATADDEVGNTCLNVNFTPQAQAACVLVRRFADDQ